jgi:hypothetical protein
MLGALTDWYTAATAAITSVCDSADNCAATAHNKFIKITCADDAGAQGVNKAQGR